MLLKRDDPAATFPTLRPKRCTSKIAVETRSRSHGCLISDPEISMVPIGVIKLILKLRDASSRLAAELVQRRSSIVQRWRPSPSRAGISDILMTVRV